MKQSTTNYSNFENLNNGERAARVLVSTAAIVVAMSSSIAGSTLFAVICFLGIALTMTGIIGWDPVRAMSNKSEASHHTFPHHTDKAGHNV